MSNKFLALLFFGFLALPFLSFSRNTSSSGACFSKRSFEERLKAAELAGDRAQMETVCREWYQSGEYSEGVLNWNYNALMSVEKGAVLVTRNEHDTYPALMLQYGLNVRTDITLIDFQLVENQDYRSKILSALNLPLRLSGDSPSAFLNNLIDRTGPDLPLYFSVMLEKERLETDKRNLYVTGLALKYSATVFDNVAALRTNYERFFRTDYLFLQLKPDRNPELVARLNLNYVPAFLLLFRHYSAAGESAKAEAVRNLAFKIAATGNRESEIRALFPGTERDSAVLSGISLKSLEKPMKKITDRLYASETELTNAEYELFLQDLLKNRDFETLMRCKTEKTDWRAKLSEHAKKLSDQVVFAHGHPDDPQSPVQNLSREAAEQYCAWITKVYNGGTAKKKYKKVLFRLPTEAEWTTAAAGGLHQVSFPWGGQFVRNAKGCYLGNFKVDEPCPDCPLAGAASDGGFFPLHADTYYPNRFGLYNASGNVAEMVQETGVAKGGSWDDDPGHCNLKAVRAFTAPDPAVGFRVFMEIIEE